MMGKSEKKAKQLRFASLTNGKKVPEEPPENPGELLKWWHVKAAQGNTTLQAFLGWMYRYGKGVLEDAAQAAKWFREAGSPDRRSWECAVLVKLREELRSGNLAVRHSKRFGRLKDYFISDQQWDAARESFFLHSGLPADPNKVPAYLKDRLNKAYDVFLRTEPENKYATAEDGRWHLSSDPSERLAPDAEARLHRLKGWLARHMPAIRLPDLLIEVDNDLRFTNHFLPANQRADRKADGVCLQLATVLAHGCNIGLHTMAQLTPDISYKQLKRVSDLGLPRFSGQFLV